MSVQNYPGPDEVRIHYTAAGRAHVQRLNCFITDYDTSPWTFADLSVLQQDGTVDVLQDMVDDWVALLKAGMSAATATFDYAELFHYNAGSFVSEFRANYTLGVAGTNGAATYAAGQGIFSFRTQEGGKMQIHLMENVVARGFPLSYSGLSAWEAAIVDFILSGDNWIQARDTSWPTSFNKFFPGENEALFKKSYRTF